MERWQNCATSVSGKPTQCDFGVILRIENDVQPAAMIELSVSMNQIAKHDLSLITED